MGRLIIDGNRVYELDEACVQRKKNNTKPQSSTKRDTDKRNIVKR